MRSPGAVGRKGKPDLPVREAIAELAQKADINRISWRGRERGERDDIEVMIERNPLLAKFGALDVALPPLAFLQPTQAGEAALVDAVMELLPAKRKIRRSLLGQRHVHRADAGARLGRCL